MKTTKVNNLGMKDEDLIRLKDEIIGFTDY